MAGRVSKLDVQDLQRQGQALYRQKKYGEALQCFDKAIASNIDVSIAALDCRAATFEKLERFQDALRDGKRMIQHDQTCCKGYLRTGKVLQILKAPDKALEIYRLGLRRVSSNDANVDLLKEMGLRLTKQLAPMTFVDPFQALPMELTEIVLYSLQFNEIVNLLRVSKFWQRLISSIPKLWQELDFAKAKHPVTMLALRQYIRFAKGKCSSISIGLNRSDRGNILAYTARYCKELGMISMVNGYVGSTLMKAIPHAPSLRCIIITSQCEMRLDTVGQLFAQCSNLQQAEFHRLDDSNGLHMNAETGKGMMKLRKLILISARPQNLDLGQILAKIPGIQFLSLRNWTYLPQNSTYLDFSPLVKLEVLDIAGVTAFLPPTLPDSLRILDLSKCVHHPTTFPAPDRPVPNLLYLQSLSMAYYAVYSDAQLLKLLDPSKGNLRKLHITSFPDTTMVRHLVSEGYLASVEDLRLKEVLVDDEVAVLLAHNCPRLRSLDVALSKISGVGVKALVNGLKSTLKWLGIDQCRNTSVDAVEYARSEGVRVSYGFPDTVARGKKIRTS